MAVLTRLSLALSSPAARSLSRNGSFPSNWRYSRVIRYPSGVFWQSWLRLCRIWSSDWLKFSWVFFPCLFDCLFEEDSLPILEVLTPLYFNCIAFAPCRPLLTLLWLCRKGGKGLPEFISSFRWVCLVLVTKMTIMLRLLYSSPISCYKSRAWWLGPSTRMIHFIGPTIHSPQTLSSLYSGSLCILLMVSWIAIRVNLRSSLLRIWVSLMPRVLICFAFF